MVVALRGENAPIPSDRGTETAVSLSAVQRMSRPMSRNRCGSRCLGSSAQSVRGIGKRECLRECSDFESLAFRAAAVRKWRSQST